MAELLAGLAGGLEYRGLRGRAVTAAEIRAGLLAHPGGRLEERWGADGEPRGYRYTAHATLCWEWAPAGR